MSRGSSPSSACVTGSRSSSSPTRPAWSARRPRPSVPPLPSGGRTCDYMGMTEATDRFRAARDLLLRHREDYDAARREFAWPKLDEFNWPLDWFDVIAGEHPDRVALRIEGDDDASLTYGEMDARSGQVA